MPNWTRVIVHHSATPDGGARDFDSIRRHHVETNGWLDIGYHAVVERVGSGYATIRGRSESMAGAHEPSANRIALGVCCVGNYEVDPVPAALVDELVACVAEWCHRYSIPPSQITGHRDHKATACPGGKLYALLPEIRLKVGNRLLTMEG